MGTLARSRSGNGTKEHFGVQLENPTRKADQIEFQVNLNKGQSVMVIECLGDGLEDFGQWSHCYAGVGHL